MYFNSAFNKVFVGTTGFIEDNTKYSKDLTTVGKFGFYDPSLAYKNVRNADLVGTQLRRPLVLASTALYGKDKVGPFHGGYQESVKSKEINPKFIRRFIRVDPSDAQNNILHVGNTPFTAEGALTITITNGGTVYTNGVYTNVPTTTSGTGDGATLNLTIAGGIITVATINNPGVGYAVNDTLAPSETVVGNPTIDGVITVDTISVNSGCDFDFYCDQTYNLRIDIKGSPALRFLARNAYKTLDHYTGCCATPSTPTLVDSTLVMIGWANQIAEDAIIANFINPIVVTELGALLRTQAERDVYVSPGQTTGKTAGLILVGAYVDTKFGDCSFQPSDFFEKEPIKILASMVDMSGTPCGFTGICSIEECEARSGQGYGEGILRNLILSESYGQNRFHSDMRLREINQGTDVMDAITRDTKYTKYLILHSVPRYNNPSGVFDNDQYLLEIIVADNIAAFETFMATWLAGAENGIVLETDILSANCTPVVTP